jgi:hypothetical protein
MVLPEHDKTATEYVFTSPYARIRKDTNGTYILYRKKRVAVTLSDWKE